MAKEDKTTVESKGKRLCFRKKYFDPIFAKVHGRWAVAVFVPSQTAWWWLVCEGGTLVFFVKVWSIFHIFTFPVSVISYVGHILKLIKWHKQSALCSCTTCLPKGIAASKTRLTGPAAAGNVACVALQTVFCGDWYQQLHMDMTDRCNVTFNLLLWS